MQKKHNFFPYILQLVILIPFLYPLILNNYYITADYRIQIIRFWTIIENFKASDYLSYWSNLIYYGYGSPMFLFYPPFYFYLLWLLYKAGIGFFGCFQILNIVGFILTSFTMFSFARNFFNRKTSIIAAFIYTVSSYHLYTIYRSGQFVEAFVWFYIPLLFHLIYRYFKTGNHKYYFYLSLLFGVFLITHHSTFVIIFIPLIIYIIFLKCENSAKKVLIPVILSLITGILLSAYFSFPCISEKKSVLFGIEPTHDFSKNFRTISEIFFFFKNQDDGNFLTIPLSLNLTAIILFLLSIPSIINEKTKRNIYYAFILILFYGIFFNLRVSVKIWKSIDILKYLETPDRFLIVISFALSLVSVVILNKFKKPVIQNFLMVLMIFMSYMQVRHDIKVFTIEDEPFQYLKKYYEKFDEENFNPERIKKFTHLTSEDYLLLPVTFNYTEFKEPINDRIIYNAGNYTLISETPSEINFLIETAKNTKITANIPYYKGWSVFINQIKKEIIVTEDGLISSDIPAGAHNVKIKFELTLMRKLSVLISLFTFIFLIFTFIVFRFVNKI